MAQQTINKGTAANDGTGDTLRQAAQKINENFTELYSFVDATGSVTLTGDGIDFDGQISGGRSTLLSAIEPTSDNNVYIPNTSGTMLLDSATQTLTNKTLTSPVLTTPQINDTSADHQYVFAVSELAADRTVTLPLLGTDDTFVFANATQTLSNKTIDGLTMSSPVVTGLASSGLLLDSSSNVALELNYNASAVNHVGVTNSATGNSVQVASDGTDTNVDLNISTKGAGQIELNAEVVFSADDTYSDGDTINTLKSAHIFDNGGTVGVTLGNGTTLGQITYFVQDVAGTTTVGGAFADSGTTGTSLVLTQHTSASCMWEGTRWQILSKNGATVS